MTYLNQPDYVRYVCNCGSLKSISKIYFCRHCLKIRCGYCVCQEVDSHYCPNCMENLPSSEVRLKKNKCSNCFDCPCCFQTLSTRAGLAPVRVTATAAEGEESKDIKATPKKVYYLFCSLCRWSSRDAGIPDQSVATGGWPEQENPHITRINALIDYHKILASIEKQQCERKKFRPKRSFMPATMYSFTSALVRKRIGHPIKPPTQSYSTAQPVPSVASEEVEELPNDIFTEPIDITKFTTLEQRLQHPDMQAEKINELRPQHRQFLVKRSQRCRVCEHNVSKSDLCPQSTKFKILLAAFYHIPEVKIVTCEPLRPGKTSELLLKFCNPTQHQTQITILPLDTSLSTSLVEEKEDKQENTQGCESPNLLPATVRQVPVIEDPKAIKVVPNADLMLPHSSVILPPRDDAAEYDDTSDTHNFQDDPKLVVWRKGNKAVIRLHVTPHDTNKNNEEPIIVGFVMQHGYVNTIATIEHKPPQKVDVKVNLKIAPGAVVCEESILKGDITIGAKTIIHPRACILAEAGPIIIGEGNIIEEMATIANRLPSDAPEPTTVPVQIIGNYNVFETDCVCEAYKVGDNNILEIKAHITREIELTNGCVIGTACSLTEPESIPENTIIYGNDCQRREMNDKPYPQIGQLDFLLKVLPNYHHFRKSNIKPKVGTPTT